MSDVLGGLGFGVAWVALVAMAYAYHCRERLQERWLAMLLLGVFLAAAVAHGLLDHRQDMRRYGASAASFARPLLQPPTWGSCAPCSK